MRKDFFTLLASPSKIASACLLMILLGGLSLNVQAQDKRANGNEPIFTIPEAEVAPGVTPGPVKGFATPPALWDVQFFYNTTDSTNGDAGMAGANYINGEFWVSRWASDTLYRFAQNGQLISEFTISGLSGTRSITSDGNYLYMGAAGGAIFKVDPVNRTLVKTITINTSGVTARHCAYDSLAINGTTPGFWVGNFNTDIFLVDTNGVVQTGSTIAAATHTLGGMYGSAVDHLTSGGPYLWVFHQGGSAQSEITRLQLPAGTPTVVTHNVMGDIGLQANLTSGLAGGLFINTQLVSGKWTLGGMLQGTPGNVMFGYELADFVQPGVDAQINTFRTQKGYTKIPVDQVTPVTFESEVLNFGAQTLDTTKLNVVIMQGGSVIFNGSASTNSLAPGSTSNLTVSGWTPPGIGVYDCWGIVTPGTNQTDTTNANDSIRYVLEITDSTYSRDDDVSTGTGYVVSNTDNAFAVALYNLAVDDTLSSIGIELETPTPGDTTYAVVASTVGGFPAQVLYTGPAVIIGAGNDYTLNVPGGLPLPAGDYAFGCYEVAANGISLRQSTSVFTASTNFFFVGGAWNASGIQTARFIRPNFGTALGVATEDALGEAALTIFPNPNNGNFNVSVSGNINKTIELDVVNMHGQLVASRTMNPAQSRYLELDLTNEAAGIYFVKARSGSSSLVKKIIVR